MDELREKLFINDVQRYIAYCFLIRSAFLDFKMREAIDLTESLIYAVNHDYSYAIRRSYCPLYPDERLYENLPRFLRGGEFEEDEIASLIEELKKVYTMKHFEEHNGVPQI
jgi:hypothetical protein